MAYNVTRLNLDRLSKQSSCAPEDVLNFIYDFCKETERLRGEPMSSVAANDIRDLMKRLPWAGQFIINMARTNEEQISNNANRANLNRLLEKLEVLSKEAAAQNAVCQETKATEQELANQEAELIRIKKEQQEILASCDKLRHEIDQLSSADSKNLKEEEEHLIDQKNKLEEELESARIKNEGIRTDISSLINLLTESQNELNKKNDELLKVDNKVSTVKSEIERVEKSINESLRSHEDYMKEKRVLEEKLDEDKQKYVNEIAEINKAIEKKKQERDRLQRSKEDEEEKERGVKQEILNVEKAIENCKINCDKLREELIERENHRGSLGTQAEELDKKVIAIRKAIDDKTVSLRRAEDLRNKYLNQKNELDSQVTKVNSECALINEEIRILNRTLQEKDFAEQIQILKNMRDEKAKSLEKYNETQNEIKEIEDKIEKLKSDQKAEEIKLQEEKNKLLEVQEAKIGRSSELKLQKAGLERKILEYETDIQKLEAWMKGIEARELNEKADRLYERVTRLSDIRNKLEEVLQSSWYQTRYSKAAVQTTYIGQLMRDDMNDMKKQLEGYRANLIGVIDCLGSEHLD